MFFFFLMNDKFFGQNVWQEKKKRKKRKRFEHGNVYWRLNFLISSFRGGDILNWYGGGSVQQSENRSTLSDFFIIFFFPKRVFFPGKIDYRSSRSKKCECNHIDTYGMPIFYYFQRYSSRTVYIL